jgi:hypothetical protein
MSYKIWKTFVMVFTELLPVLLAESCHGNQMTENAWQTT